MLARISVVKGTESLHMQFIITEVLVSAPSTVQSHISYAPHRATIGEPQYDLRDCLAHHQQPCRCLLLLLVHVVQEAV